VGEVLQAVILGIIEGLSEFLPISSTGHMILAEPLLGIDSEAIPWPAFLYFIQIGAILAVIVCFWRRLWRQVRTIPEGGIQNHLITKLVIGVIPAAAIGLPLNKKVEALLEHPKPVAIALILGAVAMVLIERRYRKETGPTIEQVTWQQALLIGLAQVVSMIPGTSRAMATIMGGLMVGLPAATAVEFSFYLAIPTICGAGLVRLVKLLPQLNGQRLALLAIGFGVSFVVALGVVSAFLRYVQNRTMYPFAVYRVLLGVAVLAWFLTR
jgi:undecaprenyl-diphosphatase